MRRPRIEVKRPKLSIKVGRPRLSVKRPSIKISAPKLNADIFINPEKYSTKIPISKIVADFKISRRGVETYKDRIQRGEVLKPLVVVKHPQFDIFAVLDGHHRYYAQPESGVREVDAAVVADKSNLAFRLTEEGWLQPSSRFTQDIRMPLNQFRSHLADYLRDFRRNPGKPVLEKAKKG